MRTAPWRVMFLLGQPVKHLPSSVPAWAPAAPGVRAKLPECEPRAFEWRHTQPVDSPLRHAPAPGRDGNREFARLAEDRQLAEQPHWWGAPQPHSGED